MAMSAECRAPVASIVWLGLIWHACIPDCVSGLPLRLFGSVGIASTRRVFTSYTISLLHFVPNTTWRLLSHCEQNTLLMLPSGIGVSLNMSCVRMWRLE
uniref:Putative secreted protein n=2 Tax=Nyssorhynchus TaxID=44543 RepID=A0A2M4B5G9_9DIPT